MPIQTSPNPFALNGARIVSNTSPVVGPFFAVQCLTATVFSAVVVNYEGQAITGITIPAGTVLYGDWEGFTLTSGTVIAYKMSF
jgi:hypothetical protein